MRTQPACASWARSTTARTATRPGGTYLTCEENWNGYFGTKDATLIQTPHEKRYGVTKTGFGYRWYEANDRFDVRVNSNEPNRFGWVVEIDPFDPKERTDQAHRAWTR